MSAVECPFGECPMGGGEWCNCWMPSTGNQAYAYHPCEPCDGCYYWLGIMQYCDGSCEGHTDRQWKNKMFGPSWDGRQLIHNGRKP